VFAILEVIQRRHRNNLNRDFRESLAEGADKVAYLFVMEWAISSDRAAKFKHDSGQRFLYNLLFGYDVCELKVDIPYGYQ